MLLFKPVIMYELKNKIKKFVPELLVSWKNKQTNQIINV